MFDGNQRRIVLIWIPAKPLIEPNIAFPLLLDGTFCFTLLKSEQNMVHVLKEDYYPTNTSPWYYRFLDYLNDTWNNDIY